MTFRAALVLALLCVAPAAAQTRIVVPITQTIMPDGDIRYAVPIRVGNSDVIQALLDTGSTGLRILPNTIPADTYTDTGFSSLYAYGSGDRLAGTIATGPVSIGGAATDSAIPLEIVSTVGCMNFQPDCSAAKLPLADYGIGGDGIAGSGFQAILGISLAPAGGAANPLVHIGAKRWIITLPEPGDSAPGALILNPSDAELQNFQLFHLAALPGGMQGQDAGWDDTIPACLHNNSTDQSICGRAILDTGTPGVIAYQNTTVSAPLWSAGDNVSLNFSATGSDGPAITFAADRYPGSGLLTAPPNGTLSIVAGMLPFYAFSVSYDANAGLIGLKPRTSTPDFSTTATSVASDPGTQIEVIKMNAPRAAGTTTAGTMVLPQVITPTQ